MIIRRNTSALRTYNAGRKTVSALSKNLEKLSSGYRINRAADDAAGLCASEKMRAKITELGRCQHNASEGIDLARTADAALQEVNDMLKRARSLCIQAENGTYSDQELAAISDEMNHLFGEIDRISAGSYHNSICLFRNEVEPDFHYEYDEEFTPVGDDLQLWGELDYIEEGPFDQAARATPAKATFKLDEDIDLNDVSTLNGRSITIGTGYYPDTFYFTDGTAQPPSGTSYNYPIDLRTYRTVQSALNALCTYASNYSSSVTSASFNAAEHTITLTAPLRDLDKGTIEADGLTLPNKAPNGNGAWANGRVIATTPGGSGSLNQVDGSGSTNNQPVYSDAATASISLSGLSTTLTQAQVNNLNGNSLSVAGHSIRLSDLNPTTSMTRDQFGTALATKISNFSNLSATYDSASKSVKVTQSGLSTSSGYTSSISETKKDAQTHQDNGSVDWTSRAANFTVNVTTLASGERPEVCEVTLPSDLSSPFSFSLNGTKYLYYDSGTHPLMKTGDTGTKYDGSTSTSGISRVNISGMNRTAIVNDIVNKIRAASGGTVVVNGDKLTVTAGNLNSSMNLAQKLQGTTIHVTSYKTVTDQAGTSYVFSSYGAVGDFYKTAEIPFHLGSALDVDKLAGSGFTIGSYRYEFTKGTGVSGEHTDIDISGCTTFGQLKAAVQAKLPSSYAVELDSTDTNDVKLKIKINRVTSSINVVDGSAGVKGLIDGGGSVSYSGGVDTGHSQKAIDFSSINEENLDTLLGKGFRINCATCEGEYINVIFCWTRNPDMPAQFQRLDEGTGEMRTIHNIPVELSKITSADKIVENIVEQVKPQLKHFTDVAVGDRPTILLAQEKRIGDVKVNNSLKLGSVESGVETNFTYSVTLQKVIDPPPPRTLKESEVNIYVGSDPEPQIIPIHLPYIDLKQLRLRPPELVDLTATDQDAADWLQRVDDADIAISSARGTIGADYNRLEHAFQDLSNADINLTDSESRIRDADMAELMKEQTKLQILMQSQQSMLAQANQVPQGVLELLQ